MGSLRRTERSANAAEPRIMSPFSERNEDVNFKGSQFSAEALSLLELAFIAAF